MGPTMDSGTPDPPDGADPSDHAAILDTLDTEGRLAVAKDLDRLPVEEQVHLIVNHNVKGVQAVSDAAPAIAEAVAAIAKRLANGGRLIHAGAGTSGRLGVMDAAEIPPTFGVSDQVVAVVAGGQHALASAQEAVEDDAAQACSDLDAIDLGPADAVVATSASGRTPYGLGALAHAQLWGALGVAVVNNPGSTMAAAADIAIVVPTGPEVVAGSTRMKAGTAQKVVLNTLSTLVMVALGRTYGDLMVDMVATNAKLARRSHRIVMDATGVGEDRAVGVLAAADGEVKLAIVMELADVDADTARHCLKVGGGHVRRALTAADGLSSRSATSGPTPP